MYRSCIFCRSRLGSNRVVEHLAIGRALAFDASKGRLWVVCPRCVGWNLVPILECWEAVEECERLFHRVSRRYSGNDIGLAIAGDGTRLIRVGKPTDYEFAAWRYETRLRRRRWISELRTVVGASCLAGGVTLWGALAVASASVVVTVWLGGVLASFVPRNRDALFTQVPSAESTVPVLRRDLEYVRFLWRRTAQVSQNLGRLPFLEAWGKRTLHLIRAALQGPMSLFEPPTFPLRLKGRDASYR